MLQVKRDDRVEVAGVGRMLMTKHQCSPRDRHGRDSHNDDYHHRDPEALAAPNIAFLIPSLQQAAAREDEPYRETPSLEAVCTSRLRRLRRGQKFRLAQAAARLNV